MTNADLYSLLGVSRDASADEIKRAYRKLARQFHPDANQTDPDAEEKFKEISLAYEILSDPQKRSRYDTLGTTSATGRGAFGEGLFDLSDLFDMFFGGDPFSTSFRNQTRRATEDAEARVAVELAETITGVTKTIALSMPVACITCDATGAAPGTQVQTCETCGGLGQIQQIRRTLFGQIASAGACPTCRGEGTIVPHPCPDCRGQGRVRGDVSVEVEIPPGIETGQRVRISGGGPAGVRGGEPGDLYVAVGVVEHPEFERHGNDLLSVRGIGVAQAALGTVLSIETLDGTEDLAVPPGTQSGRVFRLRNRGIPVLGGRGRGDLLVQINVVVPEKLSDSEEELLRKLAEARGEEVAPPDRNFFKKIRSAFQ